MDRELRNHFIHQLTNQNVFQVTANKIFDYIESLEQRIEKLEGFRNKVPINTTKNRSQEESDLHNMGRL